MDAKDRELLHAVAGAVQLLLGVQANRPGNQWSGQMRAYARRIGDLLNHESNPGSEPEFP